MNRILEPFAWITVIVTATEWGNFFTQRTHEDAQPELNTLRADARGISRQHAARLALGEWHTPLIRPTKSGPSQEQLRQISVARCARVSYLVARRQAGSRQGHRALRTARRRRRERPLVAVRARRDAVADAAEWSGNFRGWEQYRKRFPQEHASTFPDQAQVAAFR